MKRTMKIIFYDDAKDVLGREVKFAQNILIINDCNNTQDEKDTMVSNLAKELRLNIYGEDPRHKDYLTVKSDDYPDHEFSIGVFYIDDEVLGLDYFLKSYGIKGVWDTISEGAIDRLESPGGYAVSVAWDLAAKLMREKADQLESLLDKERFNSEDKFQGLFAYKHIIPASTDPVIDPCQALRMAATEKSRFRKNHANENGVFFSDNFKKLHAIVNGESGGAPAVFLIYYGDMSWYLQGMRIIADTFEYVSKDKQRVMKAWLVIEEE
jgi:hypothetical protein